MNEHIGIRERWQLRSASRHADEIRYVWAHRALWRNAVLEQAAGIDWETPEYLELNHAACEAAKAIPWWRQSILNGRVTRMLRRQGYAV